MKNLTWRELIGYLINNKVDLDDTAAIQHPTIKDEILHCTGARLVRNDKDPLAGVLDDGALVLNVK